MSKSRVKQFLSISHQIKISQQAQTLSKVMATLHLQSICFQMGQKQFNKMLQHVMLPAVSLLKLMISCLSMISFDCNIFLHSTKDLWASVLGMYHSSVPSYFMDGYLKMRPVCCTSLCRSL